VVNAPAFLFRSCRIQILARRPATLTDVFREFPQILQASTWAVS